MKTLTNATLAQTRLNQIREHAAALQAEVDKAPAHKQGTPWMNDRLESLDYFRRQEARMVEAIQG